VTCYKVFSRDVIKDITPTLKQKRFGIEPELTAKVARRNYRISEMGIQYASRTYKEGTKVGWRDGVQAVWCILRYWNGIEIMERSPGTGALSEWILMTFHHR